MSQIPIPPTLPQTAAATTPENPWPVALLSAKMAEYVAKMSHVWVEGEITEFTRRPGAKVQFFTLADLTEKATFSVMTFSHAVPEGLDVGQRVVAGVKPELFKAAGRLTLRADSVRPVGTGDLLARIEALKAKLAAEGLFNTAHKKPLPFLPTRIGLIVGRNAKAKHDVLENTLGRWPDAQFAIREVAVQGEAAAREVIAALAELDALPSVDVIIIARGGGSVEDLMPFSDEALIRAVAASTTPIVSAIGHESDNPILDFVADFRASTPTDAAKNVVPDVGELRTDVATVRRSGRIAIDRLLSSADADIAALRSRPALANPAQMIDARAEEIASLRSWALTHITRNVEARSANLAADVGKLRTLSPYSTLLRGYSVLRRENGTVVSSASDVAPGESLTAMLARGALTLDVTNVQSPEEN